MYKNVKLVDLEVQVKMDSFSSFLVFTYCLVKLLLIYIDIKTVLI